MTVKRGLPFLAVILGTALVTFIFARATQRSVLTKPGLYQQIMSSAFSIHQQDAAESHNCTVSVEVWQPLAEPGQIQEGTYIIIWDANECRVVLEKSIANSESDITEVKKMLNSKHVPGERYLFVATDVQSISSPATFTGRVVSAGPKDLWREDIMGRREGTYQGVSIFIGGQLISTDQRRFVSPSRLL